MDLSEEDSESYEDDASKIDAMEHVIVCDDKGEQERCIICLDSIHNPCLLDPCCHKYCFVCIFQWYQFNPSCPLCKSKISSLLYDIRSDTEFKRIETQKLDDKSSKIDRWGCPSSTQEEFLSDFPFTHEHERRKRVYQRKIIPIPVIPPTKRTIPFACNDDDWIRKLKPWVKRELQSILEEENVDSILLIFQQIFHNFHDNLDSPLFFSKIEEFLQHYTPIFIRELRCFVKSSLTMVAYDRKVRYRQCTESISSFLE